MHVQLAGNRPVGLMSVLALWHELMAAWHPEIALPMAAPMRLYHAQESLAQRLGADGRDAAPRSIAERACGFDIVLRLASGQLNMMHADRPFFARAANAQWFTRVALPGTGFAGAQLTDAALAAWHDVGATRRDNAIEEARGLLESDIESAGVMVRLLPREDAPLPSAAQVERPQPAPVEQPDDRKAYLRALVRHIDTDPFQPRYRRRSVGQPVTGWAARLLAYCWPGPHSGYRETCAAMQGLTEASGKLAQVLGERAWTEAERLQAVQLAHEVFRWGAVPQDPQTVTPSAVQAVYEAALRNDAASKANMNSGWTKVAAFATAHLEDTPTGQPQAIWDSRVATAIIDRLEQVVPDDVDMAGLFPGLGTVPGLGGTRPRPTNRKWPSGYRIWRAQVAGSQVVRDIRDILNEDGYALPQFEGGPLRWTTRDVEMVLFMDGY